MTAPLGPQQVGNNRAVWGTTVTLLASGTRTSTGDGSAVVDKRLEMARALVIVLDITAESGTTPTLDVAVQVKIGDNYATNPLVRFAQKGEVTTQHALFVRRDGAAYTTEETMASDPAAGSGAACNNGMQWGDTLRVTYAIGGTDPSYTFSVVAYPVYW